MKDTWDEARSFVMHKLELNSTAIEELDNKVDQIKIEQAQLIIKQGAWGAIGSALPVIAYFIYQVIQKGG